MCEVCPNLWYDAHSGRFHRGGSSMTDEIAKAESAPTEVQAHIGRALSALGGFNGRIINGFGVYADVSRQHLKLIEARDSIAAALKIMTDTSWPTDADYDTA